VARSLEDVLEDLIKEFQGLKYDAQTIRNGVIDEVSEMIDETRLDRNLIRAKLQAMK
jgi:hypothetical protein